MRKPFARLIQGAVALAVLGAVVAGTDSGGPDPVAPADAAVEATRPSTAASAIRDAPKGRADERSKAKAKAERKRRAERERRARRERERKAAERACDPSYEGACLDPNAVDYDCSGGSGNGPKYTGRVRVVGDDHFDLDRDGDGVACE